MRKAGYALIGIGFLVAAYFTVVWPVGLPIAPYLIALVTGIVGVVLVRVALRREASQQDVLATNLGTIGETLRAIVAKIEALDARKNEIDVFDLRHHIDRELPPLLDEFVLARQSIAHRFGLQPYADVMNPFSAGERYVNRVWSCSTDGYITEAHEYLTRAREQFEEALAIFERLRAGEARV